MWGTQRAQVSSRGVFHSVQDWNWCPKAQFMAVTALTRPPPPSLVCTPLKS